MAESAWRKRQHAHRNRVAQWVRPHRERRRRGQRHPVYDFLFEYYSFRPGRLERWHPGPGVLLTGDVTEFLDVPGYRADSAGAWFDPSAMPPARRDSAAFVHALLTATAGRPARYTCFGLHEWAMLYRTDAPRHERLPLRLGRTGTDAVVERLPLRCTHYDAFRFFTPAARPRNDTALSRDAQLRNEQPGCLHTNMDVYKWAYKLAPGVPSELVADCFELALEIRELDMRASPYDLSELGHAAVAVETPAGRADYARQQARFAARAANLRQRLIRASEALLVP